MDCYKWDINGGCFVPAVDPTANSNYSSVAEAIWEAGYQREFSSSDADVMGASVAVYRRRSDSVVPTYYVDLMGENSGIATFVADDFFGLLATLQQINPFLALIRLDQHAWSAVKDSEE